MRWLTLTLGVILVGFLIAADLGFARPVFLAMKDIPWGDKICHFLLAGGFSCMIGMTLAQSKPDKYRRVILGTIIACLLLTTLEEFSQQWFVARSFSLGDLACNYAGILVFGIAASYWRPGLSD